MIWPVFIKSIKEQLRNYWILLLTISLAPFFVFIYYLINEASQPSYDILVLNQDRGAVTGNQPLNMGEQVLSFVLESISATPDLPLKANQVTERQAGLSRLEQHKADVLLVIPAEFSSTLMDSSGHAPTLEIIGDLTRTSYIISAVWLAEILNEFMIVSTGKQHLYMLTETPLGYSAQVSEFDMWMPGILILAIIMLMFSATIAIITEVDKGTILRLKLSKLKAWQFLLGVGGTQIIVGIVSILLTLMAAVSLGFELHGSYLVFLLITVLASISMIAFSLILAAVTRSVTDVLIVGNFPLFLFMFFTGAAFPMRAKALFHIGGYEISWQSLMSPTHAINALNKISIMGLGLSDILPELAALTTVTIIYFLIGIWGFQKRHL